MRTSIVAAGLAGMSSAAMPVWAHPRRSRPFRWRDAADRAEPEFSVVAPGGHAVVVQVARPLSAKGEFLTDSWGGILDSRGELWMLDGELGRPRRLPVLPGGAWEPSFSPDGKRLAALTLTGPGKVGVVVWGLARWTYRTFSDPNVELLLARFRTEWSAYSAPSAYGQVPRQYLWLDQKSILYVDHGPTPQQFPLAKSSLSSTIWAARQRTDEGYRSVRVWSGRSPTCGSGSRLVRLDCESGSRETIYEGDVRGISLSPNNRTVALIVATANIAPAPNRPMQWPLLGYSGLDDSMVALKLVLCDLTGVGGARDVTGVTGVGDVAPSRLPRWSPDSSRVAVPVRATYSEAPSTGNDAVWDVTVTTGEARRWVAVSALDAELVAALLTSEWLNSKRVIDERPRKVYVEDYTLTGQITGGAWRWARGQVLFWNAPELTLISSDRMLRLPGRFSSVVPPARGKSASRTLALEAGGRALVISTSDRGYRTESLSQGSEWNLLAINPDRASFVYRADTDRGTFLILAEVGKARRRSALSFNTYFREVLRPEGRMLTHTFPDGSVRKGLLLLPFGHRKGERHPVVVFAYPDAVPSLKGPFCHPNSFASVVYPIQYLLTRGFAFFQAPFPIGENSGKSSTEPMRAAADAVLPWLDVLGQQQEVKPGEYGFFGHSNAGYVALALEALTTRFKAIVAWGTFPVLGYATLHTFADDVTESCAANLVQSFRMYYEAPRQPFTPKPAPPWKNSAIAIRNDPLFQLRKASTPLLLVEGEFDVDPKEMEEVYSVLYGKGVPVELAYYWGEGHVFMSPGNIRDSWSRTEGFFRKYLQAAS